MGEVLILRGWINAEHLKCGLPGEHFKTKEHRYLVVRSNPAKLFRYSFEPVFVKITIERDNYANKTFKFSKAHIHEERNGFKNAKPSDSYLGPAHKAGEKLARNKERARRVRKSGLQPVNSEGV